MEEAAWLNSANSLIVGVCPSEHSTMLYRNEESKEQFFTNILLTKNSSSLDSTSKNAQLSHQDLRYTFQKIIYNRIKKANQTNCS